MECLYVQESCSIHVSKILMGQFMLRWCCTFVCIDHFDNFCCMVLLLLQSAIEAKAKSTSVVAALQLYHCNVVQLTCSDYKTKV
jgi:hypothetical protein